MPNGQPLQEEMKKGLEQKLSILYRRMQQETAMATGLPSGALASATALGTQVQNSNGAP
jgi:hypothetical protein